MIKKLLFLILFSWINFASFGQVNSVRLGYYAPYAQFGINLGAEINVKTLFPDSTTSYKRVHKFTLLPQLGYYYQPDVQYNLFAQCEGIWISQKVNKRFLPFLGIGLGYMASFQKQVATIHLGTGEVNHTFKTLHRIVPTLNAGFGIEPKKRIGMYFKLFYGGRFTFSASNDAYGGGEIGLRFKLSKPPKDE